MAELEEVEAEVQTFKADAGQKQFRLDTKKSLGMKISQVSATMQSIRDCTLGLLSMLGQRLEGAEAARRRFVEYSLAERLADEAEVGIMSQPRSAWPKARVAARVFARYPDIWRRFQALVFRACPYAVPTFAGSQAGRQGRAPGQRPEECYERFAERMVAYQRLWLAVLIVQGDHGVAWRWLARTLNEPQAAPISAPLLLATLEMFGAEAQARYGRQFVKLVAYIDQHYMPQLEMLVNRTGSEEREQLRASKARLRRWLDSFRASGRAPAAAGSEPEKAQEEELNPDA